jgi:hypothetical protein
MLVSHKEYGSTGKELPSRKGEGFSRKKESGKKDETVILFEESGSDPGTSGMRRGKPAGKGDVWMSTPKNAS